MIEQKKQYEFVFGNLLVSDLVELNEASEAAKSGNMVPLIRIVDRFFVGDIFKQPMLETQNIMAQFSNELEDYMKGIGFAFEGAGKHD